MRFNITLQTLHNNTEIPINYAYYLSSAIYKIIATGDNSYADFLHRNGYGRKGLKLFTFSQINVPFKINGDRLQLLASEANFQIAFHAPEAMENFIKGLFQSEKIDITDKKSKASFTIKSIETLPNVLQTYQPNELVSVRLTPLSPMVAQLPNERGKNDYLDPNNKAFTESLIHNWRTKIETIFDKVTAENALLILELAPMKTPFKSRLITIKGNTAKETKIRGWMNFTLKATGDRRFVELLLDAGVGVYNAQGMGYVGVEK